MVHALAETFRILENSGMMIDLRPLASGWPVEVLAKNLEFFAGRLDDRKRTKTDLVTNNAVLEAVQRGWFRKENEVFYEYAYYWDSVDKMKAFIVEDWSKAAILPNDVAVETKRVLKEAGPGAEIRIRRKMMIASYQKLTTNK